MSERRSHLVLLGLIAAALALVVALAVPASPIHKQVRKGLDPRAFGIEEVLGRIEQHGDLFEGVLTTRQSLGSALASIR